MYGHSMAMVSAWGRNVEISTTNHASDVTDLYIFGGWEWFTDNEFGENLSGPILSERNVVLDGNSKILQLLRGEK